MPRTLTPHPRIVVSPHTQSARHYHSDLSIWLSVDPMSDKYPSLSPYTYCANNPVRLVDPNGMTWETPEDENKANEMLNKAQQEIANNYKTIFNLSSLPEWVPGRTALVREYEDRITELYEGIDYINEMGNSSYSFHFGSVNRGAECYSAKTINNDHQVFITIFSDDMIETRWHESIHVGDWLCGTFEGMTNDGVDVIHCFGTDPTYPNEKVLGHSNDGGQVEKHAYQSEFAFSRKRFDGKSLKPAFFLKHITGEHRTDENR